MRRWRGGVPAVRWALVGLVGVAAAMASWVGVAGAATVVHPVITQTDATFVLPLSDDTTPVGTTWRLNLWNNTTKLLVATQAVTSVAEESALSIDVKVPTTPTCYFQADIRFTAPGQTSTLNSGTYYSGDIATVPGCGPNNGGTTTTTTTTAPGGGGGSTTTTTIPGGGGGSTTTTTTIGSSTATTDPSSSTTTSTTNPHGGGGSTSTTIPGGGGGGSSHGSGSGPSEAAKTTALPFTSGSTKPKDVLTAMLAFTGSNILAIAAVGGSLTAFGLLLLRRRSLAVTPKGVIVEAPDLHDEW